MGGGETLEGKGTKVQVMQYTSVEKAARDPVIKLKMEVERDKIWSPYQRLLVLCPKLMVCLFSIYI